MFSARMIIQNHNRKNPILWWQRCKINHEKDKIDSKLFATRSNHCNNLPKFHFTIKKLISDHTKCKVALKTFVSGPAESFVSFWKFILKMSGWETGTEEYKLHPMLLGSYLYNIHIYLLIYKLWDYVGIFHKSILHMYTIIYVYIYIIFHFERLLNSKNPK